MMRFHGYAQKHKSVVPLVSHLPEIVSDLSNLTQFECQWWKPVLIEYIDLFPDVLLHPLRANIQSQ